MPDVNAIMVKAIGAHPPGDSREEACAAFYELLRARQRQERPTDPVGLLCVVADALRTAARSGAITGQERNDALHETLQWAAEMTPRRARRRQRVTTPRRAAARLEGIQPPLRFRVPAGGPLRRRRPHRR